ncbi:hypothetical protein C4579_02890 [Candidatus Microgenomates bacterium]|nr:MAG: hypothetical protein C4579_02890 [Candidatus Microgenomates bacterium]
MKKQIILLTSIFIIGFLFVGISRAQEDQEEASPSTKATTNDEKVQLLKDKLATKVAELRESQKRGFFGTIAALTKTSFTLVTPDETEIKVKFDEDTLIYKPGTNSTVEGTVADLKNTETVAVLGLFDEENKSHSAKVILLQEDIRFVSGTVSEIDTKAATLTLKTNDDESMLIEYERTTNAQEFDPEEKDLVKSGLSRFEIGDRAQVWGTPDENDVSNLAASRILRMPQELFVTEDVAGTSTESSPSATPKSSPKASPKATASEEE